MKKFFEHIKKGAVGYKKELFVTNPEKNVSSWEFFVLKKRLIANFPDEEGTNPEKFDHIKRKNACIANRDESIPEYFVYKKRFFVNFPDENVTIPEKYISMKE